MGHQRRTGGKSSRRVSTLYTADADYAGDQTTTELITGRRDASWTLWENIARKFDDFGKPDVFCAPVSESKWKSFTVTMHSRELLDAIEAFSDGAPAAMNVTTQ